MADVDALLERLPSGTALLKILKELNAADGQAIKALVGKLLSEASAMNGSGDNAVPARVNLDDAAILVKNITLPSPRGKFDLAFMSTQLVISSAKQEFCIPYGTIRNVVILDNIPQDKQSKVLLFLALSRDVTIMNGKQRLDNVVIQSKADARLEVARGGQELSDSPAAVGLCMGLGQHQVTSFINPDPDVFTSAKGRGVLAVEAIVKVSSGWLFPMAAGLCFVERPAQFLAREDIRCVELPRMGTGQTFDMLVHLAGGTASEFKNISMAEADRLVAYLQGSRIRIGHPDEQDDAAQHDQHTKHSSGTAAGGAELEDEDEDSDDEDDEDFDPAHSEEEEEAAGQGLPAKKAKVEAAQKQGKPSSSKAAAAEADAGSEDIGDSDDDEEEEEEEEGEDEYETDEDAEEGAATGGSGRQKGAGGAAAAQAAEGQEEDEEEDQEEGEEEGEEEDDDEDDDSDDDSGSDDVDLIDEEGISAENMRQMMAEDKKRKR